ncbi:hypothetical protein MKZ38_000576 [Zalerion maritima]|uniref:Mediator of RNA polymerase II transcription subunit 8 n=1 Tax=Zalerion maritima TaxID=339359 RepID=A0AAD5RRB5_9PEZI|nr:hypothetical protein MKZ38_000576 [Zalerion maritima]
MDQDVPLGLTLDAVKTLDQVRMRLSQLTHSMQSLAQSVYSSNPLPDPVYTEEYFKLMANSLSGFLYSRASLQAFHNILQKNLESLNTVLTENSDLFSRVAVHPSTNFDGRKFETVLLTLLRKKLETAAEIWADEGRGAAVEALPSSSFAVGGQGGTMMTATEREDDDKRRMEEHWKEQDDLAERVRGVFTKHIKDYISSEEPSLFTKDEKESGLPLEMARTGLRRDLVKEEKAMFDEEDEDQEEDVSMANISRAGEWQQQTQQGQMGQMQPPAAPAQQGPIPEHLFWFGVNGDWGLPKMVIPVGNKPEAGKKTGPGMGR